jgi:hypothetical protein
VKGLVALVAAPSVIGNVLMTGRGTEKEITGMTGTEGEGVVLPVLRGDVLPALIGGLLRSVSMTGQGPLLLLMI